MGVFDICHGCRRCFNLCDSFPILFDAIDASPNEQIDDLTPAQLGTVVDACTLCDMCFMTKGPYVPPHPFDLDFPHLMLRHRDLRDMGFDVAPDPGNAADREGRRGPYPRRAGGLRSDDPQGAAN